MTLTACMTASIIEESQKSKILWFVVHSLITRSMFAHCPTSALLFSHPPPHRHTNRIRTRTLTRTRASMDPPVSAPAVAGFPYLPPSHRDLMVDLLSSVDTRLGSTLLPSAVPPDVLCFENRQGTSQGALDIRSGAQHSSVDFILESWLHCKVPTGDLNITTVFAFLNTSTDAPHLLMEFIQGSPTSLILFMDLLPRKDLVLHPEYLEEFYNNTRLDKLRQDLELVPQVSPYRSSSLYIRSVLSPTAVAVTVDCGAEGESCMEELIRVHVSQAAKAIVEVWMDKCASSMKDLEEPARAELLKRDGIIKNKTIEIDLAANLPRLFGPDVASRIVGEIQEAFRIR